MQSFSKANLPGTGWKQFRKTAITDMLRVDGEFTVDTSEGPLRCEDGWLATDARGYPYLIAADEQALIYEPFEEPADKLARVIEGRHPGVVSIARYFAYRHLPDHLQTMSKASCQMAADMIEQLPDGAELTTGLRKLLEAKDCFVRAALD